MGLFHLLGTTTPPNKWEDPSFSEFSPPLGSHCHHGYCYFHSHVGLSGSLSMRELRKKGWKMGHTPCCLNIWRPLSHSLRYNRTRGFLLEPSVCTMGWLASRPGDARENGKPTANLMEVVFWSPSPVCQLVLLFKHFR